MRNSRRGRPQVRRRKPARIPVPILAAGTLFIAAVLGLVLIVSGDAFWPPLPDNSTADAVSRAPAAQLELPDAASSPAGSIFVIVAEPEPLPATPVAEPDQSPQEIAQAFPTDTPSVDATVPAEPEPILPPTATPEPTVVPPLPTEFALNGLRHMWQTWNNCGPATLAMNLSYFGSTLSQAEIGAAIRTHPEDKNVNADELVAYAHQQGFAAQARVNGDGDLVRRFISSGIPVLIETWLEPEPGQTSDGFGHYRLLTGYDDATQRWIAHDSYVGVNPVSPNPETYAGIYLPYDNTDRLWAVYNRTYVLVYRHDQSALVSEILGEQADPTAMWQGALEKAQATIAAEQAQGNVTPFSWFNLGSALYHLGHTHEAAAAFDQARAIGLPWRMLWYQFEPFAAYYHTGRYQDVVALAQTTLATSRELEEVQYWYGMGQAALGDTDAARRAFTYVLELKPGYIEAQQALAELQ